MKYLYLILLMVAMSIGYMAPASACEGLRPEVLAELNPPPEVDPSRDYDCAGLLYIQSMKDTLEALKREEAELRREVEQLEMEAQGLRPA